MRDRTKEAAKKTVLRAADQIRVEVDTEIGTILLADHARAMEHAGVDEEAVALFDVEIVMIDLKQHGAAQNIDHFNLRMPVALQGSGGIAGENDALKDEWKLAASVGTQLKHFFRRPGLLGSLCGPPMQMREEFPAWLFLHYSVLRSSTQR